MPLSLGKSKAAFSKNVATEMNAGKPQPQALAIAYSQKRKAQHMAEGGEVGGDEKMVMDQMAEEMMRAMDINDKEQFMNALQAIVHNVCSQMIQMNSEGDSE